MKDKHIPAGGNLEPERELAIGILEHIATLLNNETISDVTRQIVGRLVKDAGGVAKVQEIQKGFLEEEGVEYLAENIEDAEEGGTDG